MASGRQQQQHPLSGSGGGGIGRSAPIRTLPGPGAPPPSGRIGGPPTPPLVKSKLVLTPGRTGQAAAASSTGQVARATRSPVGPLPPSHQRVGLPRPPPTHQHPPHTAPAPQYRDHDPFAQQPLPAPSAGGNGNRDPVLLARQGPGAPAPGNSSQTHPHIVALPPPKSTTHPLEASVVAAPHRQQAQRTNNKAQPPHQQGSYKAHSPQPTLVAAQKQKHHPLGQPYKLPEQPPAPLPKKQAPANQHQTGRPAQPSTLDEEVDAFLRGDGSIIHNLRPSPLPGDQSVLLKVKSLASRRAWGDVIRVTNEALLDKDVGLHHCCYSELVAAASTDTSNEDQLTPDAAAVATGSDLERLRRETSELMALRFTAQLKLRRYADLGKEVDKLGLIPHLPDYLGMKEGGVNHARALSGITPSSVLPASPVTPGTLATEASIDVLSSSPVVTAGEQSSFPDRDGESLAWKEGSIHSSRMEDATPSWVPFGLRVLAAQQLLQHRDGMASAIDVLYDLRDRAVRIEYWKSDGMEIWRPVVDNALANAFVRKKEWRLALRTLEDMLRGLEDGVCREADWWCNLSGNVSDEERLRLKELITAAARTELQSRQLLILLQSGAIPAAEAVQDDVRLHAAEVQSLLMNPLSASVTVPSVRVSKELALVRQVPLRLLVNEGLLLFAQSKYADATKFFRDALRQQRELEGLASSACQPVGCPTWKDLASPALGFGAESSLTVECLNNLSLCLLYSGNMRGAVRELEELIREDPRMYLTEGVAFNLCTLYELGSDGEECARKKRLMQRVAKRFYLHDIGAESFRLG